jgi:hypothetical protein
VTDPLDGIALTRLAQADRVAERTGLALARRGQSTKGPERLILSDRELPEGVLGSLTVRG